jgi:hypothetical protein
VSFGARVARLLLVIGVAAVATVVAGAVFAWAAGRELHPVVTSALFIAGFVLIAWNAFAGGGVSARRMDVLRGDVRQTQMSFSWILVGVALVGLGVVSAIL